MQYLRLAGCGLFMLALVLTGCGRGKDDLPKGKHGLATVPTTKTGRVVESSPLNTTAPRTSDEWRTYGEQLKNERDEALRVARGKDGEIAAVNARIKEQELAEIEKEKAREQAAIRKEHEREASIGRRVAFICFAVSTVVTILSFLPIWWTKLIPKWAGPMGVAAGIVLLIASHIWIWVADHILYLSLGAGLIGVLVVLMILKKGVTLLSIRQWFTDRWESAASDAEELHARADALEKEIVTGVHAAGQALRGKPLKTMDDVIKLRAAAFDAERSTKG